MIESNFFQKQNVNQISTANRLNVKDRSEVKVEKRLGNLQSKVAKVDRLMVFILSITTFLLPWIFTHYTYEFYEVTKNTFLIISVIILLVLWSIKVTITKKLVIVKSPFDIAILVYLLSKVLSTIFSIYSPTSIWGYYSRFTGGLIADITLVLLYYLVVNNITIKKDLKQIILAGSFSIVLLALFTIFKSFGMFDPIFDKLISAHPSLSFLKSSIFTPIGNTNCLPFIFLMVLPILISLLTGEEKNIGEQIFAMIGSCICIFAIGITAISSLNFYLIIIWVLVFVVIASVFLLKLPLNQTVLMKFFPIFIFTIFSILFSVSAPFRRMISEDINFARYPEIPFNTSWSVLMGTYQNHKIGGFLIGTGLDTYAYDFSRFRPAEQNLEINWNQNYTKSTNQIFEVLTDSGLVGLLSFIFFILIIFIFVIRKILRKDISDNDLTIGIGISILIILFSSILTFYSINILFILWLLLGVVVSMFYVDNERKKERFEISLTVSKSKIAVENETDIIPYFLLVLSCGVLLVCSFFVIRNYAAEVQYKKSLVASNWGDLGGANDYILKAIQKNSSRDYYHKQFAYVALQALNTTLSQTTEDENEMQRIQAYQNYLINLIKEEISTAIKLNNLDSTNWESAAVIFKQLVEISEGKMFGDDTLYAASQAINLNPYNPDNYIILGYIYQFNTNEELKNQAEKVFIQAYNLQQSYPLSIFALGNYFEFAGKYDDAIILYRNSIDTYYSSDSQIHNLLEERIELAQTKKEGAGEGTSIPTDEEINEEVKKNVIPDPTIEED